MVLPVPVPELGYQIAFFQQGAGVYSGNAVHMTAKQEMTRVHLRVGPQ